MQTHGTNTPCVMNKALSPSLSASSSGPPSLTRSASSAQIARWVSSTASGTTALTLVVDEQVEASRLEEGVGAQGTVKPNGKSIVVECGAAPGGSRSVRRTRSSARSSPVYSERSEVRITFVRLTRTSTSESSGGPGTPTTTLIRTKPLPRPSAGLPSPTPIVRLPEPGCTGLHEGNASGGPWVRLAAVQGLAAGTSGTRRGVALFGRAWGLRVSTGRGCQSGS